MSKIYEFFIKFFLIQSLLISSISYSAEVIPPNAKFISVFFHNDSDTKINFYNSVDGKKFLLNDNIKSKYFYGRDPNLIFFKNNWYLAHTGVNRFLNGKYSPFGDFTILKSTDLNNWTSKAVPAYGNNNLRGMKGSAIGGNVDKIVSLWAPTFFIYHSKLYITFSVAINKSISNENSSGQDFFSTALVKVKDLTKLTISLPKIIINPITDSIIDTQLFDGKDGFIYSVSKSEINGDIIFNKSKDLSSKFHEFSRIKFKSKYGFMVEAPNVVWNNKYKEWFMYLDRPASNGKYYYLTSINLKEWSHPKLVNTRSSIRHGNVINIK
ncbi:family 43 glycosylhydrolase [Rosenbergiella metrosideri]|uniref:family 43 glycosylhydrolase n=1 Tax=Rosenbergiella metrosideri TaxID=2921185 RepID=UPI001F502072|nr:family 43 glycosylhydrolase [Rosenbergiella metrosideri]